MKDVGTSISKPGRGFRRGFFVSFLEVVVEKISRPRTTPGLSFLFVTAWVGRM